MKVRVEKEDQLSEKKRKKRKEMFRWQMNLPCRRAEADNGATHGVTVSMPPMLLCGFESRLGPESLGFSMWHFLKLVAVGFLRVLWFPPLLPR